MVSVVILLKAELTESLLAMPEIIMCYLVEQSFKFIYKVLLLYIKKRDQRETAILTMAVVTPKRESIPLTSLLGKLLPSHPAVGTTFLVRPLRSRLVEKNWRKEKASRV
jgi:cobalamin synthase